MLLGRLNTMQLHGEFSSNCHGWMTGVAKLQLIIEGLSNRKEVKTLEETICRLASQNSANSCINLGILTPFSGKTSISHLQKTSSNDVETGVLAWIPKGLRYP